MSWELFGLLMAAVNVALSPWWAPALTRRGQKPLRAEILPVGSIGREAWDSALALSNSILIISSVDSRLFDMALCSWWNARQMPFTDLRELTERNLMLAVVKRRAP